MSVMQAVFANSSSIKLRLMEQFYGIEEFLDLEETLPAMLNRLDHAESEFDFIVTLSDLDIWYIKVTNSEDERVWNPFLEPLRIYAKRYELLVAHLYPEKQWTNDQILGYAGLPKTQ